MKILAALLMVVFLQGCLGTINLGYGAFTLGAAAVGVVVDRYEKYQIEKRLEVLEKPLDKKE
jgi:hypothetical protein